MRGGRRPTWEKACVPHQLRWNTGFFHSFEFAASGQRRGAAGRGGRMAGGRELPPAGRSMGGRGVPDGGLMTGGRGAWCPTPGLAIGGRGDGPGGLSDGGFVPGGAGTQHGRLCSAGTGRRSQTGTARRPRSRRRDAGRLRGPGTGGTMPGFGGGGGVSP